jgi:hypothetical protein
MSDVCRRIRRPFFFSLLVVMSCTAMYAATLALKRINDTIYRADGRRAGGTLLLSWPAFSTAEAVTSKDIVDDERFKSGLAKVVDGTVECLNASIWAKQKQSQ